MSKTASHPNNLSPQDCEKLEAAAIKWVAHLNSPDLTEKQEKQFFTWLNASPANQAAYIEAEKMWQLGGAIGKVESPSAAQSFWQFQAWQGWSAACAIALFAVFIFVGQGPAVSPPANYQTAIGEQKEILLDDNSKILLNTNSKIVIEYLKKQRIARLEKGEALFDVTTDSTRPFDVITSTGQVRVLGTRFAVQQSDGDSIVTVIEGKVGLSKHVDTDDSFEALSILEADEQLSIQAAKAGAPPVKIDADRSLAWRDKQLIYKGETLDRAIDELNRYFEQNITIEDTSLGQKSVIAVIHLGDFESTVSALAHTLKLEPTFNEDRSEVVLRNP